VRAFVKKHDRPLPDCVERQLKVIEVMNEQVVIADRELEVLAKQDPICKRLMTVPGVGPLTSVRFLAAIDEVGRFPDAHALQSYLGLTPGEDSSSNRKRITSITKAGARQLRWCLVQAAWSAQRVRGNDPMVAWAKRIGERRGKGIATVALARKIAGVLYALWRDGSSYEMARAADTISAE
jgi:transposase